MSPNYHRYRAMHRAFYSHPAYAAYRYHPFGYRGPFGPRIFMGGFIKLAIVGTVGYFLGRKMTRREEERDYYRQMRSCPECEARNVNPSAAVPRTEKPAVQPVHPGSPHTYHHHHQLPPMSPTGYEMEKQAQ
ncbi:uncharacterized protein E0L32_005293 [Thyridium curvatum]|uniref:Uncharacterized protein n=1 Tax=Thyridium curvatum TaxID=1093900 RepID=A0A507BCB9_9PEZI|nr:uncharacterized protein E0L32_005293 [Thyridium curvatum]TPX14601.1 hypothetical protein E0L32_005293 [Thyridium curvatum]